MGKVLIIGAGGVATVAAHKVAQNADVFTEIMIASRTKSKCDAIVEAIGNKAIKTARVDADDVEQLVALFESFRPDIVMNLALPYQDLTNYGGLSAYRCQLSRYRQLRTQRQKPISSIVGSGLTKTVSRKPVLRLSSVAGSTRV